MMKLRKKAYNSETRSLKPSFSNGVAVRGIARLRITKQGITRQFIARQETKPSAAKLGTANPGKAKLRTANLGSAELGSVMLGNRNIVPRRNDRLMALRSLNRLKSLRNLRNPRTGEIRRIFILGSIALIIPTGQKVSPGLLSFVQELTCSPVRYYPQQESTKFARK